MNARAAGPTVVAVCTSPEGGIPKHRSASGGRLIADHGFAGDYHAGPGDRQVSLIELEVLESLRAERMAVGPGVLGENLTIQGLPFAAIPVGARLRLGEEAVIEITKVRHPCVTLSPVDRRLPRAVMGRCGLLAKVVAGGIVRPSDPVTVLSRPPSTP